MKKYFEAMKVLVLVNFHSKLSKTTLDTRLTWKENILFWEGIEPTSPRLLVGRDNHYTIEQPRWQRGHFSKWVESYVGHQFHQGAFSRTCVSWLLHPYEGLEVGLGR